jgi:hypothetical protein
MQRIAIAALGLATLCACEGVRASTVPIVDGQPVYPLHVHPSLSGAPAPADWRAPGRGTRGSPNTPPFFTVDYRDPPEMGNPWARDNVMALPEKPFKDPYHPH